MVFILSFSVLMTTANHHSKALRGLSRWTLAFVTNGLNTGFRKRRHQGEIESPTPNLPPEASIMQDSAPSRSYTPNNLSE